MHEYSSDIVDQLLSEDLALGEMSKETKKSIENALDKLFNELVPPSGTAETYEGELIRAIMRIIYRYHNDGDIYNRGYGRQTVNPSVRFLLSDSPPEIRKKLSEIFVKSRVVSRDLNHDPNQYTDKDPYDLLIFSAAKVITDYVNALEGKHRPNPGLDSR